MLNNIAVVLIGEWRTGSIVSKYIKHFFNNLSQTVDYYIISYNNVDEKTIKNLYPNTKIQLIDSTKIKNVYFSRAYLSKLGFKLIGKNFTNYEQIIETRPDLFLKSITNELNPLCNKNEFMGANFQKTVLINEQTSVEVIDPNTLDKNSLPRTLLIGDSYFRMSNSGYCCYANRFDFDYGSSGLDKFISPSNYNNYTHGMTAEFLIKNDFVNIGCDYQFETIIRNPDMINYDLNDMTFEEIQKLNDKNHFR